MILGSYEVPRLGTCEIERDCTQFNPTGKHSFKLTRAGSEIGHFAFFSREGGEGPSLQLTALGVTDTTLRGKKLSSFMMVRAIEYAKEIGVPGLSIWALNERTVSVFASNFPEEQLSIRLPGSPRTEAGSTATAEDAIRYLEEQRARQYAPVDDPDGTRMLKGPAVYMEGLF